MPDLYEENQRTVKDIKNYLSKWKDIMLLKIQYYVNLMQFPSESQWEGFGT